MAKVMSFFKKNKNNNFAETEAENIEKTEFPNSYDNRNIAGRRFQWSSRLLAFLLICSSILNLTLVFSIAFILPLKTVVPLPVERADGDNILAQISPFKSDEGGLNFLAEDLSMQYVIYRQEIVRSDLVMKQRWLPNGYIDSMSTAKEYKRFYAANGENLKEIRQQDSTLEVHIQGEPTIITDWTPKQHGAYQIKFAMISKDRMGQEFARRYFLATMETDFIPIEKLPSEQRPLNPSGFKVINYTLAERNNIEQDSQ